MIDNSFDICQHITLMAHEENFYVTPYFESAHDFIANSLGLGFNVLVHCKDGMSKSPILVASYIMLKYKLSAV